MPVALPITKAYLQPVRWNQQSGLPETTGEKFYVQFNPTSLKVNYANQKAGQGQPGSAPIQFVGKGTTKLTVELLFDVTVPLPDGSAGEDVRDLTQRVAKYLEPQEEGGEEGQYVPPGIRFGWDTFQFDGVVDSMDETLDFFSNTGKPLRATVSLQVSRQEIKVTVPPGSPGTQEQHQVENGETLQQAAGPDDWQDVAAANGIENPRMLEAGALVDLKAGLSVGVSGGFSAGVSGGFSAGVSGGFSAGVSGGLSGGLGGGVSGSLGLGGSGMSIGTANTLSLGVATGLGYGASSRTSLAGGLGGGFGAGGSASFGASASASASASAGGSASASAGASASTRIR